MKKVILTITLLLFANIVYSQNFSVKGSVLGLADKKPLPGASITLINSLDSIKKGTTSDVKGNFIIKNIDNGNYIVKITYIGFQPNTKKFIINNKDVNLGMLFLVEKPEELGEVVVEDKMPPVEMQGDTTQFNAGAFKTQPDANADELVQKMPGIVVQDNKVQAQGEDVKQVLMDGKPFFGNDPMAALRNIPADVIDKVQVYDQKSEQSQFTGFDDGQTLKTLNVITRANMRIGQFGKAYAGYGTENKYEAGTNINFFDNARRVSIISQSNNVNRQNFSIEDILGAVSSFGRGGGRRMAFFAGRSGRGRTRTGGASLLRGSGGSFFGGSSIGNFLVGQQNGISTTHALGINYSDEWSKNFKVSGSYFINYNDNSSVQNTVRDYILETDSTQTYLEDNNNGSKNINHRFNFRFDYDIDSSNSILFTPRLTLQQNDGKTLTSAQTNLNENMLNSSNNNYKSDLLGANFSGDLLFRHKFNTKGRTFSTRLGVNYDNKDGNSSLEANTAYYSRQVLRDTLDQKSALLSDGMTLSYNLSYTEPLWENSMLEIEYSGSYLKNASDKNTNNFSPLTDSFSLLDTSLSSVMKNDYYSQTVGTSYQYSKDEANFTAGVDYKWSNLNNDQQFPNLFNTKRVFKNFLPNLRYQYRFSRFQNLRIFYRTSTNIPSISQLQDVIDNSNPLQLSSGNPNLDESYQHNLFMNYFSVDMAKSSNFFAMLGGSYSNNYIGQKTTLFSRDTILSNNMAVQPGTQLSKPENLENYWNIRSFVNFGMPVGFIESNFNINAMFNFQNTPGMINNTKNYSQSKMLGIGLVLSSNISPEIDFSIFSNSNINYVSNSIRTESNTQYFNQSTRFSINTIFWEILVLHTEINHQYYSGLSSSYNINYLLWNASIGLKLFENRRGEIRLSVFDILKQNNAIQRNVTDIYIEDTKNNVLQRYFLLSFIYTLKNFGDNSQQKFEDNNDRPFRH